jgi:hypothetical protein
MTVMRAASVSPVNGFIQRIRDARGIETRSGAFG